VLRFTPVAAAASLQSQRASPETEKTVRELTRRIRSDVAVRQRRAGVRRVLSTTVFEALGRKSEAA
jgi:hypothetical protein